MNSNYNFLHRFYFLCYRYRLQKDDDREVSIGGTIGITAASILFFALAISQLIFFYAGYKDLYEQLVFDAKYISFPLLYVIIGTSLFVHFHLLCDFDEKLRDYDISAKEISNVGIVINMTLISSIVSFAITTLWITFY